MPLVDNYLGKPGTGGAVIDAMGNTIPPSDWIRWRQPYLDKHRRACLTVHDVDGGFTRNDAHGGEKKPLLRNYLIQDLMNRGLRVPVTANAATLTKEQWIQLDTQILMAYRQRLTFAARLKAAVPYGGFNAYAKRTLEYYAMSDVGTAYVDMDAETDGTTDTPQQILLSTPLPITHSDFGYSDRELETSRQGPVPMPFDTIMEEQSGRRVGEAVEDQALGLTTGPTYGTQTAGYGTHTGSSTVYGATNYQFRLTKTNFTAPTTGGWVPNTTYNELLVALNQLYAQFSYGPFAIFHSTDWSSYMDQVFAVTGGNNNGETLRTMLLKIPNVQSVERVDRLTSTFTLIVVALNTQVVRFVNGMDIHTIAWQEKGGLSHRFKTLAIQLPQWRRDYAGRTGLLHGTTA